MSNHAFLVRMDALLEQGLTQEVSTAMQQWDWPPEEWELHQARWNVNRAYFVRYRRMNIPLTMTEVAMDADYAHEVDAARYALGNLALEQWGAFITIPSPLNTDILKRQARDLLAAAIISKRLRLKWG